MLGVCVVLGLIMVALGYGPWQRWIAPTVLVVVGWGVVTFIRGRNGAKRELAAGGR
jgi:hypothetical protein